MVRDFDLKLKLTAVALRCTTAKELYRKFQSHGTGIKFELQSFYKWVQGKSTPRASQVYLSWAQLLGLHATPAFLSACSIEQLAALIVADRRLDQAAVDSFLQQHARPRTEPNPGQGSSEHPEWQTALMGNYLCYSNALSLQDRQQVMRSSLNLDLALHSDDAMHARYVEVSQAAVLKHVGTATSRNHLIGLDVSDRQNGSDLYFNLYSAGKPANFLFGHKAGASIGNAMPQPRISRVLVIRLPRSSKVAFRAVGMEFCGPLKRSITEDLISAGLNIAPSGELEQILMDLLTGTELNGFDQLSAEGSHHLNRVLDAGSVDSRQENALPNASVNRV